MKRKLASLMLSLAMVVQATGATALAADSAQEAILSNAEQDSIVSVLQFVEHSKGNFKLEDVEFSGLYVGTRIQAYEYVESGFEEIYSAFPLLYNNELVALAIEVENGNYQISSGLAAKIDDTGISNFSLVYDSHAVYLYDGEDFTFLSESSIEIPSRLEIEDNVAKNSRISLDLCNLNQSVSLRYFPEPESRIANYYECPVEYVPQGYKTKLCWAATIACISNYVKGTELTADEIAIAENGEVDYQNYTMAPRATASLMRSVYKLNYTYKAQAPSDNVILRNIKTDYPLYSVFQVDSATNTHAATIYGVNVISGFIMVMDPEFGSVTANTNGYTYTYISEISGAKLTLDEGICYTW
jgi:hypothetical protein